MIEIDICKKIGLTSSGILEGCRLYG